MTERGFFDGEHVELIDGEIVEMAAQKDEHAFSLLKIDRACRAEFGPDFVYRIQMTFDADTSQPEPDYLVMAGPIERARKHPTSALLIIEVSDTTLAYDRTRKSSLCASRKVADYWIVNLTENTLEVRRRPARDANAEFGWSYASTLVLRKGEIVSPLALKKGKVAVADLLP